MKKSAFLLAASILSLAAITARAQTPTVIDHLPYVITAKGNYVLTSDLGSNLTGANLIEIDASNVIIDMQGHYISGPVGAGQTTRGIYANERSNLTIQNGTVANVYQGIYIEGNNTAASNNRNHSLDNLRVTQCSGAGIVVKYAPASSVTNCKVSQIASNSTAGSGINIYGAGTTVQGCTVSQVLGSGSVGIFLATGSFARQNTLSDCSIGIQAGKYQDNLTANCATPFSGGTNAGGNN